MPAAASSSNVPDNITARFLPCGDAALTVELGSRVDRRVSALVLALTERVKAAALAGIIEVVPTFRSLTIHYDPLSVSHAALIAALGPLLSGLPAAETTGRHWYIPICYHESLAPDLAEVAGRTGLTTARVAEAHAAVSYHVYMMGFLPGHPYMGDLPSELELPRRQSPRTAVPAGSVSIATTLSAIYPLESPGGWHLIGRTPAQLWDRRRARPAILAAGDQVRFQALSLDDYGTLAARAAAGEWRVEPDPEQQAEQPAGARASA